MFLLNSHLGLFTAALSLELPFSLTYGVILQSSLTTILSLTLGFSPCPRVFVLCTGYICLSLAAFLESWHQLLRYSSKLSLLITSLPYRYADLPTYQLPRLNRLFQPPAQPSLLCHYFTYMQVQESLPVIHRLRFSASP